MIGMFFVYVFIWGASYAVGNGELQRRFPTDKHKWMHRPLSLVVSAMWPLMFTVWTVRNFCRPNPELTRPASESVPATGGNGLGSGESLGADRLPEKQS